MTAPVAEAPAQTPTQVLEAKIYDREIAAGRPDNYARAFAAAFIEAYLANYAAGFEAGYVEGQQEERSRLRDLARRNVVHDIEAQRWLLARELDPVNVGRWLAERVVDEPIGNDGAAPMPQPASVH